ncbi:Inositol-1,4,5-trisphosphate 5-phosphatase 1 [Basidiobolus ranarum]|uniref:Inositol-1,4,5-trisphosphate 5-phosphatase 1 n=1 Tax=Basidiobolus ranarum TaxID=34480 RepID=A0ABR2VVN2_9FUNG
MLIFVRQDNISKIRNIQVSTKKTGLKGMAGNKGGIGIRFDFDDTSICLVTAHLAAGSSNFQERNEDYATITNGIRFAKGRSIDNHDYIIWFGDFNYRINLEYDDVMDCIYNKQLSELLMYDQLNQQIQEGRAFEGFQEGIIAFDPTYKYDNGTDTYDTSEKQRRPAWTDRILYRGKKMSLLKYINSSVIRVSDHKPVMGLFELEIVKVDHKVRDQISHQLYSIKKKEVDLNPRIANVAFKHSQDEKQYKEESLLNISNDETLLASSEEYDLRSGRSRGVAPVSRSTDESRSNHLMDSDNATERSGLLQKPNELKSIRAASSDNVSLLDRDAFLGKPQLIEISPDELETSWIPLKPKSSTPSGYLSPVNIAKSKSDSQLLGQVANPYTSTPTNNSLYSMKYDSPSLTPTQNTEGSFGKSSPPVPVKKSTSTSPKLDRDTLAKPLIPERKFKSPSAFAVMKPLIPERNAKPSGSVGEEGPQKPPLPSRSPSISSKVSSVEPMVPVRRNVSQKTSILSRSSSTSSNNITSEPENLPTLPQRTNSLNESEKNESNSVEENEEHNSTTDTDSEEEISKPETTDSNHLEDFNTTKWKPLIPERSSGTSGASGLSDKENLKKPLPPTRKPRSPLIGSAMLESRNSAQPTTNLRRTRTLNDGNINSSSQSADVTLESSIHGVKSTLKRTPPPIPVRASGTELRRARTISEGNTMRSESVKQPLTDISQTEENVQVTDTIPDISIPKSTLNVENKEELSKSNLEQEKEKVDDKSPNVDEKSTDLTEISPPVSIKDRMAHLPFKGISNPLGTSRTPSESVKVPLELGKKGSTALKSENETLNSSKSISSNHGGITPSSIGSSSVTKLKEQMKNQIVMNPNLNPKPSLGKPSTKSITTGQTHTLEKSNDPPKSSVKDRLAQFSSINSENSEKPKPIIPLRKPRGVNAHLESKDKEGKLMDEKVSKEKTDSVSESSHSIDGPTSPKIISNISKISKRMEGSSTPLVTSSVKTRIAQLPISAKDTNSASIVGSNKPLGKRLTSDSSIKTTTDTTHEKSDNSKVIPQLKKSTSEPLPDGPNVAPSVRNLRAKLVNIPMGPGLVKKPLDLPPSSTKSSPSQDEQSSHNEPMKNINERTAPIPMSSLDMHKKRPHPRKTARKKTIVKPSTDSNTSSTHETKSEAVDTSKSITPNVTEPSVNDEAKKKIASTAERKSQLQSIKIDKVDHSKRTIDHLPRKSPEIVASSSKDLPEKVLTLGERKAKLANKDHSDKKSPTSPTVTKTPRGIRTPIHHDAPSTGDVTSPLGIKERTAKLQSQTEHKPVHGDDKSTLNLRSKGNPMGNIKVTKSVEDKSSESIEEKVPNLKARKSVFETKKPNSPGKLVSKDTIAKPTSKNTEITPSVEEKLPSVRMRKDIFETKDTTNLNTEKSKLAPASKLVSELKGKQINNPVGDKPSSTPAPKDLLTPTKTEEKAPPAAEIDEKNDTANIEEASNDDSKIHGIQARKALLFGEKTSAS